LQDILVMRIAALIMALLLPTVVSAQTQKPTTGYAPVNGLNMYYEIHGRGSGPPLVLLHGSFMAISSNFNWTHLISEFSRTRRVIAVEMQGHGRTAATSAMPTSPMTSPGCSIT
jgi:pimeloyl-ACP methyl ester carboxylesterase